MNPYNVPVITVDGSTGSGKGTLSFKLAKALGWHYLESGVLYRLLGLLVIQNQLDLTDEACLVNLCNQLCEDLKEEWMSQHRFFLKEREVTSRIRAEDCSAMASKIGAFPSVRQALLPCQRKFRRMPGLVTDGRDMGTVVFPDACVKLFLKADPEIRAKRRYLQLKEQGIHDNLPEVFESLKIRDQNDKQRNISPLKPAPDAIVIDTTELDAKSVFRFVMGLCKEREFV